MRQSVAAVALLFAGCGKYADFSLPVLTGGDPELNVRWEEAAGPVLPRETTPDVLNPSVLPGGNMFYSEWDGRTWHTAQARSVDGLHWLRISRVLSPDPHTWESSYIAANGSALLHGKETWYWYVAGPRERPRIGLARQWRKEARP